MAYGTDLWALVRAVHGENIPEGYPPSWVGEVLINGIVVSGQEATVLTEDRRGVADCLVEFTKRRRVRTIAVLMRDCLRRPGRYRLGIALKIHEIMFDPGGIESA